MKQFVLAVYDSETQTHMHLHAVAAIPAGIRNFKDACADEASMLNRHRAHFALWQLGTFDDVDGLLFGEQRLLMTAEEALSVA